MKPEDLRVGGGGARRLAEKPLHRWWVERRLPEFRLLPLKFFVVADEDWDAAHPVHDGAWLILEGTRDATRCYLQPLLTTTAHSERVKEHLLSVLYAALDAVCAAFKPPDVLRLAKAYWWRGHESEADAGLAIRNVPMSRRRFDNQFPRYVQAPRYDARLFRRECGNRSLRELVATLDLWHRDPRVLRPNASRLSDAPPGKMPLLLRAKHGDPMIRLLHDHWHHAQGERCANYQGAWPIPRRRAALQRMFDRIEATARLIDATERVLDRVAWSSKGGFG